MDAPVDAPSGRQRQRRRRRRARHRLLLPNRWRVQLRKDDRPAGDGGGPPNPVLLRRLARRVEDVPSPPPPPGACRTQTAVVSTPRASEPCPSSVSAKQPRHAGAIPSMRGAHAAACAALPSPATADANSPAWTPRPIDAE